MAKFCFTNSSLLSAFKADDPKDRQAVVWDSELRGLGAYRGSDGTGTFFVLFRGGERQRKVTLGRLNELTVPEARRQAGEILIAARLGRDVVAFIAPQCYVGATSSPPGLARGLDTSALSG